MERIKQLVLDEIISSLTIGKIENNEVPYNDEQIKEFITQNKIKINQAVHIIYLDYVNDDKLDELIDPNNEKAHSWVREYMSELI